MRRALIDEGACEEPRRPLVRYFGSKWRLAPWIISHLPAHRVYVEPFGGGGSVLLRKPRSYAEVYNDMDGDIVSLFRVARDRGEELVRALHLSPFARDEFEAAHGDASGDEVEEARRLVIRSYMGFGADSVLKTNAVSGFRANSNRSGSTPAHDWMTYPESLRLIVSRLRGVVIENRDALRVMRSHDGPETLHYADPPYVHETRSRAGAHRYKHEMDRDQHAELIAGMRGLAGMVAISGYENPLYCELLADWPCVRTDAFADGAQPRVECLWLSPSACLAHPRKDPFGFL